MAERAKQVTQKQHYDIGLLHAIFAVSSILLLVTVVWMVIDDHFWLWKNFQRNFRQLQLETATRALKRVSATEGPEIQKLLRHKADILNALKNRKKTIAEIEKGIAKLEGEKQMASFEKEQLKSQYDALKYAYEVSYSEGHKSKAKRLDKKLKQLAPKLKTASDHIKDIEAKIHDERNELRKAKGKLPKIEKTLQNATRKVQLLKTRVAKLQGGVVETLRNMPILDFAGPTLKIRKVVINDLYDDYNFVRVPKIDRCPTCHVGIEETVVMDPKETGGNSAKSSHKNSSTGKVLRGKYETAKQPFTSHPRLDLFLADSSPHPMNKYGCTICHEGAGNETDFSLAAHTPRDEHQMKEWADKYGWTERHYWDHPMLPLKYTQARCAQCHDSTFVVPQAEKLSLGRKLYYDFNCYNCHKTKGYESFLPYGPKLTFLNDKLQRTQSGEVDFQWLYNWIKAPRKFRPSTRMPHFFYLSNTSSTNDNGVDYVKRNRMEIMAIAHYLVDNSKTNNLAASFDFAKLKPSADAKNGKKLVETIGCFGCHHIGKRRPNAKPQADFGPHLSNLGHKTTFEWLFSWIKDPTQHWPKARMPNFRLSDTEAADIAAYLVSLKDENYKPDPLPQVDIALLDDIVIHYLEQTLPPSRAAERAAEMTPNEKLDYAGDKLIRRYGCFSCHLLEGFDDMKPIGTDQSEAGSKPLSRVDFGFVIPHEKQSRYEWLRTKIKNPRSFDKGRKKTPYEKLKMPKFNFSDTQVEALVTFMVSLTTDIIPPHRKRTLTEREKSIEAGRELVRKRNCLGCHSIERPAASTPAQIDNTQAEVKSGENSQLPTKLKDIGPNLSIEGQRVRYMWLREFLQRPMTLRPKNDARMPTLNLSAADADTLVAYLAYISGSEFPFASEPRISATTEEKLEGETFFELSNCQSCHQVGDRKYQEPTKEFYKKDQMKEITKLVPDLQFARERLRADWAQRWIRNPQAILPETKMPNLKLLDRDVKKLVQFIFTEHLAQSEWRKWVKERRKKEEEKAEEFGEFE